MNLNAFRRTHRMATQKRGIGLYLNKEQTWGLGVVASWRTNLPPSKKTNSTKNFPSLKAKTMAVFFSIFLSLCGLGKIAFKGSCWSFSFSKLLPAGNKPWITASHGQRLPDTEALRGWRVYRGGIIPPLRAAPLLLWYSKASWCRKRKGSFLDSLSSWWFQPIWKILVK